MQPVEQGLGLLICLVGHMNWYRGRSQNTIATIGGMVCDGAKSSCATKIASAVECALLGLDMAKKGHVFQPGEGIVKDTVEKTIESMGRVGRVGMHETDIEILHIMMGK